MKRALLLALSLAAALALLWLCTRRPTLAQAALTPPEVAVSQVPVAAASASAESEPAAAVQKRVEQASELEDGSAALPGPKAEVRGRVVRVGTQEPVHSGEVQILFVLPGEEQGLQDSHGSDLGRVSLVALLDEQGHFRFELPIGTSLHQLTVIPLMPDDLEFTRGSSDAASLFAVRRESLSQHVSEAGVDLLVEVEGALELSGLVRDAETLIALEGVRLRISEANGMVPDAWSGPRGRFTLVGIPPQKGDRPWTLRADRMDYLAHLVPLGAAQLASGAQPLIVELSRGLTIAGSVVDLQGVPVRGAALRFRAVGFDQGLDFSAGVLATRTDERGEFRYAPVPPCSALSVELQAQRCDGRDLLPLQRDLGPLRADRTDLQLEVQSSGMIEVHAQLADGTPLGPREFQVLCTNVPEVQPAGSSDAGIQLRVPLGVELALEVYTRARDEPRPAGFLRARQSVRLEPREPSPRVVLFVLAERSSFSAPPPREGVRELSLPDESYLRATVDVQLLDAASGLPLGPGPRVSVSGAGASVMTSSLQDGWLRIRGRPGSHDFEVEVDGGTHELLHVLIPASGYGTAEWRLKVGP